MATCAADAPYHDWTVCTGYGLDPVDTFAENPNSKMFDPFNWKLTMVAPEEALALRFKYVFMSVEYDKFISSQWNDKFYVILESENTNGGTPTVINFTECRDPDAYYDFICESGNTSCEEGEKYCYIAINSALSECCWYPFDAPFAPNPEDPPCPDGTATTDLSGTGFSCADDYSYEISGSGAGMNYGSSTGWLQTSWPIEPGKEFTITFHIHDTSDGRYDSQVILDSFEFLGNVEQGTGPV